MSLNELERALYQAYDMLKDDPEYDQASMEALIRTVITNKYEEGIKRDRKTAV